MSPKNIISSILLLAVLLPIVASASAPPYAVYTIVLNYANRRVVLNTSSLYYTGDGVNTTVFYGFDSLKEKYDFRVVTSYTKGITIVNGTLKIDVVSSSPQVSFTVVFPAVNPYNISFYARLDNENVTYNILLKAKIGNNTTAILDASNITSGAVIKWSHPCEYYELYVNATAIYTIGYRLILYLDNVSMYANVPVIETTYPLRIYYVNATGQLESILVNNTTLWQGGEYKIVVFDRPYYRVWFYDEDSRALKPISGELFAVDYNKTYNVTNTSYYDVPLSDLNLTEDKLASMILGLDSGELAFKLNIYNRQWWRGCVGRNVNDYACRIYVPVNPVVYTTSSTVTPYYVQVLDSYYNIVDEQKALTNNLPIFLEFQKAYIVKIYDSNWSLIESYYVYVNGSSTTTFTLPTLTPITYIVNISVNWSGMPSLPEVVKMIALSTFGKIALIAVPVLVLLVSGRHFSGIAAIIAGTIALALNHTTGIELFSTVGIGLVIFIGILGLFLEQK